MATLRLIWNIVRVFWWAILLVVAIVFLGILYLVKKRKQKTKNEENVGPQRTLIEDVATEVATAVTDVRIERAIIGADTKMRREALEEIRKEPDGEKRRKKLAAVLSKSL